MGDCPACGGTSESDGKRDGHHWYKCIECGLYYPLCRYCFGPLRPARNADGEVKRYYFVCDRCEALTGFRIFFKIVDEAFWRLHFKPNNGLDVRPKSRPVGGSSQKSRKRYDKPGDFKPKRPLDAEREQQHMLIDWFGRHSGQQ